MLFAKALSILFSLFAGLESAKGALYHFVCGKGKDRAFPYLKEIKQHLKTQKFWVKRRSGSSWSYVIIPKDYDEIRLQQILLGAPSTWEHDLLFCVGTFGIHMNYTKKGIELDLFDTYDWHSSVPIEIPKKFINKLPKLLINILGLLNPLETEENYLFSEFEFAKWGIPYLHKGNIFYSWSELEIESLYEDIEEVAFISSDDYIITEDEE